MMLNSCNLVIEDPVINPTQQHQNANMYTYWKVQGDEYYNIDQRLSIQQLAPSTYWALTFRFKDMSTGGYMGLQTTKLGSKEGIAIFSLWEADSCQKGSTGSYCVDFSGEGVGKSCRIPFNIQLNHIYRLRVWRLENDNLGQWWGAWVKDLDTGIEIHIGKIRVKNAKILKSAPLNFVEYFGGAVSCDKVPQSIATYYPPTFNNNDPDNSHQFGSSYDQFSIANCVKGSVIVQNGAAKVTHGGK